MTIEIPAAVAHRLAAERLLDTAHATRGDESVSDSYAPELLAAVAHALLATHGSNIMIAAMIDALRETVTESGGN
jgi:hypothetical protein